jgi:ABC-type multidrug transport system fused ATPase/permease subunit
MKKNIRITGTFIWTLDDLIARKKALVTKPVASSGKLSIFSWLVYGLLAVAIVWIVTKLLNKQIIPSFTTIQGYLPLIGMYLFLSIVLWATYDFIQKRKLKQSFLKSADSNKSVLVTITSDEIVMKADGSSETRWSWKVLNENA